MCFSAQASFIGAGVLTVIGLVTIASIHTRRIIPFALAPLIFAVQQALEGIVWVTLNTGQTTSTLHRIGVYGFLSFVGMFWPLWAPISLWLIEPIKIRRHLLIGTLIFGILVAAASISQFVHSIPTAHILNHHLVYSTLDRPFNTFRGTCVTIFYLIATVGSFLISSVPLMWLAGLIVGAAWVITITLYYFAFGSLWCFFGALASMMAYLIVKNYR